MKQIRQERIQDHKLGHAVLFLRFLIFVFIGNSHLDIAANLKLSYLIPADVFSYR